MNDDILRYLKTHLGEKTEIEQVPDQQQIPFVFKEKYDFYTFLLNESKYLIVEVKGKLENISILKKHLSFFRERFQMEPIIYCLGLSYFRKNKLLEEKISYMDGKSIYITHHLLIQKSSSEVQKQKESLSALAQSIIRYFLFEKDLEINVTEMAKRLEMTEMSASRGLKELYDFGFLEYSIGGNTGRSKSYRLKKTKALFEEIVSLSRTPVRSTVYAYDIPQAAIISGLSALSKKTNISDDGRMIVALHKQDFKKLELPVFQDSFALDIDKVVEIQEWSYQPNLYSSDRSIDDFSLICLFKDSKDERISMELEKLERKHRWFME